MPSRVPARLSLGLCAMWQPCEVADDYSVITYEVDDPVAVIAFNRPQALNAWVEATDDELHDALARAAGDPRVVAIVVTGAGRGFSAGADMQLLSRRNGPDVEGAEVYGQEGDFEGRLTFPMSIPKPVIAAVNGPVVGMSLAFALACDIRVLSPEAMFVTAFSQRGLIAEWGISWLLPRQVGPSAALDLLWTSRRVGAEEAMRLGLGNYLVEADDLLPFCRRYVEDLAAKCSPTSLAIIKRQVYEQLHTAIHSGLGDAEREAQRLTVESFRRPDFKEGVKSFLEKRPPSFARQTQPGGM